jgi:hypothetical protein
MLNKAHMIKDRINMYFLLNIFITPFSKKKGKGYFEVITTFLLKALKYLLPANLTVDLNLPFLVSLVILKVALPFLLVVAL